MSEPAWDQQVASEGVALRDADCLIRARQRLDGLALDILTAPGMAGDEVGRLRTFLARDWVAATEAADRLVIGTVGTGKAGPC